ncbi:hypothetical protein B0H17DRAFT_1143183 [Mycena rosella]|uniref:Uncharacterized protein n=1 Tax=Mycena rosella TaxID=1033263 RepID=A0AAD7CW84_MYCRO|nr:hypothetical protein B0H17DRAFT_1143183 [Mycena rosella]
MTLKQTGIFTPAALSSQLNIWGSNQYACERGCSSSCFSNLLRLYAIHLTDHPKSICVELEKLKFENTSLRLMLEDAKNTHEYRLQGVFQILKEQYEESLARRFTTDTELNSWLTSAIEETKEAFGIRLVQAHDIIQQLQKAHAESRKNGSRLEHTNLEHQERLKEGDTLALVSRPHVHNNVLQLRIYCSPSAIVTIVNRLEHPFQIRSANFRLQIVVQVQDQVPCGVLLSHPIHPKSDEPKSGYIHYFCGVGVHSRVAPPRMRPSSRFAKALHMFALTINVRGECDRRRSSLRRAVFPGVPDKGLLVAEITPPSEDTTTLRIETVTAVIGVLHGGVKSNADWEHLGRLRTLAHLGQLYIWDRKLYAHFHPMLRLLRAILMRSLLDIPLRGPSSTFPARSCAQLSAVRVLDPAARGSVHRFRRRGVARLLAGHLGPGGHVHALELVLVQARRRLDTVPGARGYVQPPAIRPPLIVVPGNTGKVQLLIRTTSVDGGQGSKSQNPKFEMGPRRRGICNSFTAFCAKFFYPSCLGWREEERASTAH